jgi:hypothetical protein
MSSWSSRAQGSSVSSMFQSNARPPPGRSTRAISAHAAGLANPLGGSAGVGSKERARGGRSSKAPVAPAAALPVPAPGRRRPDVAPGRPPLTVEGLRHEDGVEGRVRERQRRRLGAHDGRAGAGPLELGAHAFVGLSCSDTEAPRVREQLLRQLAGAGGDLEQRRTGREAQGIHCVVERRSRVGRPRCDVRRQRRRPAAAPRVARDGVHALARHWAREGAAGAIAGLGCATPRVGRRFQARS